MDTTKPLNDQPVELTLSFESVKKIEAALDAAKAHLAVKRREALNELANGSNSYFVQTVCSSLASEITYLADLQRALTMWMDNVADTYADLLLSREPDLAKNFTPSPETEEAVDLIVKEVERLRAVGNKPSLDELTELARKDANGFTHQELSYIVGEAGNNTNL